MVRLTGFALLLSAVAACASGEEQVAEVDTTVQPTQEVAMTEPVSAVQCAPQAERMPIEGRASPYDSTLVNIGGAEAKVCYGRPSLRGREMIGGELVPYDTLWRTGANEPTTIHLPVPARIAGIQVEPGSYSLYTVPGQQGWTIIVNRSVDQWGIERAYTPEVRAGEVGRAQVLAESTDQTVEQFTIESEPAGANAANLVLEWQNTRVEIPIERG